MQVGQGYYVNFLVSSIVLDLLSGLPSLGATNSDALAILLPICRGFFPIRAVYERNAFHGKHGSSKCFDYAYA